MPESPLVSVIMSVHNGERFLGESVDSILRQTFADFEFIIVDDGSTDASHEIIRRYAERDARIVCIRHERKGLTSSLNDAIALARGELFARMDADDIAHPARLQRQIEFLNAHPDCVAVGSSVVIMDEDGNDIHVDEGPTEHAQIEERLLAGRGALCHPTVMMRASAVRQVGGYREQYHLAQDMDLFLRLGEVGRLANIREPLLRYRWHLDSIGHRKNQYEAALVRAAMIKEACRRRGLAEIELPILPPPKALGEKDLTIENYHRWSVKAEEAGRFAIARKYALAALRLDPLRKKCWWVLCNSLLGNRPTRFLTRCYQLFRFWRPA
jgi:glycosyltransferase involved in cell wall biosynthesis